MKWGSRSQTCDTS